MERAVFQSNKVILIAIITAIFIGSIIVYLQTDLPIWIIPIVLVAGVFFIFASIKTKLVIEDGMLRYEKLTGGDEADLQKVSHIVMREVETIVDNSPMNHSQHNREEDVKFGNIRINNNNQQQVDQERKVEKLIYVLDDSGRTFFSFPANVVRFTHRTRFKEAIQAVNPDIQVF